MSNQILVPATCYVAIRVRPATPLKSTIWTFLQSWRLPGIGSGMRNAWARYWQSRTDRRAFQAMLELNDAHLADVGVTRQEVLWANGLPLSQNAALRLREIADTRRKSF